MMQTAPHGGSWRGRVLASLNYADYRPVAFVLGSLLIGWGLALVVEPGHEVYGRLGHAYGAGGTAMVIGIFMSWSSHAVSRLLMMLGTAATWFAFVRALVGFWMGFEGVSTATPMYGIPALWCLWIIYRLAVDARLGRIIYQR